MVVDFWRLYFGVCGFGWFWACWFCVLFPGLLSLLFLVVLGCDFGLRWMGLLVGIVGLGVGCGLDAGWRCVWSCL